jgi:hypothetical protein
MVETDHLIDRTTISKGFSKPSASSSEKEAVALSSDHTPTAKVLGEISKQNRAAYSDEGKNNINRFRKSSSTISRKLLSIDGSVGEISAKNKTLRRGFLVWETSRALTNPAIWTQPETAGPVSGWGTESRGMVGNSYNTAVH